MLELAMAAARAVKIPAVFFDEFDGLANFHTFVISKNITNKKEHSLAEMLMLMLQLSTSRSGFNILHVRRICKKFISIPSKCG
jgi:hypothetical protein